MRASREAHKHNARPALPSSKKCSHRRLALCERIASSAPVATPLVCTPARSLSAGEQIFEKLLSGMYLGHIAKEARNRGPQPRTPFSCPPPVRHRACAPALARELSLHNDSSSPRPGAVLAGRPRPLLDAGGAPGAVRGASGGAHDGGARADRLGQVRRGRRGVLLLVACVWLG